MKRFVVITILVAALAALFAGTAMAAGPTVSATQGQVQGFGPGAGIHTPGTGLMTPGTGIGVGGMTGRGAPEWAGQVDEVQTLLGMTPEAIQAERLAGKSLAQIAEAKDISEDTLISTILDAKKADLAQLVADGKLTQAQADTMLSHMESQVKTMVERTAVGRPTGQPGVNAGQGLGMRGGRWSR